MNGPTWSGIELEQCALEPRVWAVETRRPITECVGYNDMPHSTDVNTFCKDSFLATIPLVFVFVLDRKGNWFLMQREEERQESLCRAAEPWENAGRQRGCYVNCSYKRPKKI